MALKFVDQHGTRYVQPTKTSGRGRLLLQRFPETDRACFVFQPPPNRLDAPARIRPEDGQLVLTELNTDRKLPRVGERVFLFQAWTRLPYTAEIAHVHFLPLKTRRSTAMGLVVFKATPRPRR